MAAAHRQRQLEALSHGKLAVEDFVRFEAKRAANRLQRAWRKDPWLPGRTIDLGVHEDRFQLESGLRRLNGPVAPAVLDWLRWKYRRLQVDRRRDSDWALLTKDEYPQRVRDAGPPPRDYDPTLAGQDAFWSVDGTIPSWSKRSRGDRVKAVVYDALARIEHRGRIDPGDAELGKVAHENHEVLAPLSALCRDDEERKALVLTLWDYLNARPGDLRPMKCWLDMRADLSART
jgi:hypothetical protein